MSLYLWRWLALPPTTVKLRVRLPRWLIAGLALLLLAVGGLALVVPTIVVSLLTWVLAACGVALGLSGTLRGLYWSVDTALVVQRYVTNTGWATLQATPEGALSGVLEKLRQRVRISGVLVFQRSLWLLLIVIGALGIGLMWWTQPDRAQADDVAWIASLVVFVLVDSAQSLPLGALVGLISARASSSNFAAALAAGGAYSIAKIAIFMLSASFVDALGAGALLILFGLHEGLLWLLWRILHGTYDVDD